MLLKTSRLIFQKDRILKLACIALFSLLTACITDENQKVPVVDGWLQSQAIQDEYRVKEGDTIYSIAWDFGLDYRAIVQANHLSPPYTLMTGEILKMTTRSQSEMVHYGNYPRQPDHTQNASQMMTSQLAFQNVQSSDLVQTHTPSYRQYHSQSSSSAQFNSQFHSQPSLQSKDESAYPMTKSDYKASYMTPNQSTEIQSGPRMKVNSSQTVASNIRSNRSQPSSHHQTKINFASSPLSSYISHWLWPTRGKVIEGYSTALAGNHGLNIAGVLGQPIRASAAGTVVYSGTGVRGYGNLIIIKHNASYLSAYAYNQQLLVKLGQKVQAGQIIATMGRGEASRVMLHFEIRHNGQPVNPIWLLHGQ